MSAGMAKVQLLLELKEKMKAGLTNAKNLVSKEVAEMKGKLDSLKTSHIEAFSSAKDQIPGLGSAIGLLTNPIALVTAGVIGLTALFGKAKGEAELWEKGMSKINVTAGLAKPALEDLSNQIKDIGTRNVAPLEQVPEAFNKIISSGMDVNTSLATLEPTLRAAKAGFTEVDTVAKAAVSTMNSSGIMDATKVYDILFATLNKGNAEFADIAQYLPKIVPGARAAGYSLEQVAGSYAFLTAQGLSAEQSSTGLMNLFKSLSSSDIINGTKNKLGLKGLGIDVFDAAGKAKPLVEVIGQLTEKTKGLTNSQRVDFMANIGFDMETATAISSMSQNLDKLKENIDYVTNSKGALDKAYMDSSTAGDIWDQMKNMSKGAMIDIGKDVNVSWGNIGAEILPMFADGLETFKAVMGGIWDFVVPIGKALWGFEKSIFSIVGGMVKWITQSEILKDLFSLIGWVIQKAFDILGLIGSGIEAIWNNVVKPIVDGFDSIYTGLKEFLGLKDAKQENNGLAQSRGVVAGDTFGMNAFSSKPEYDFNAKPLFPGMTPDMYQKRATTPGKPVAPKDKKDSSGTAISGKAEQVRNVTIHIDTFGIKGDFISQNVDFSKMSKAELKAWFNDILNRFTQDLETSYG